MVTNIFSHLFLFVWQNWHFLNKSLHILIEVCLFGANDTFNFSINETEFFQRLRSLYFVIFLEFSFHCFVILQGNKIFNHSGIAKFFVSEYVPEEKLKHSLLITYKRLVSTSPWKPTSLFQVWQTDSWEQFFQIALQLQEILEVSSAFSVVWSNSDIIHGIVSSQEFPLNNLMFLNKGI